MSEERRRHVRIKDTPVEVVSYQGAEGIACNAMKDISRGGARLVLSGPETPGMKVTLGLKLPGSEEPAPVEGQVVWARKRSPFEVGIQFLSLAPSELLMIGDEEGG